MSGSDTKSALRPEESVGAFTGLLTRLEAAGAGPAPSGRAEEQEPVSPELALVDPELGRWARTELPDVPPPPPRVPPAREREAMPRSAREHIAPAAAPVRPAVRLTPAEYAQVARRGRVVRRRTVEMPTHRGRKRSIALWVLLLLVSLAAGVLLAAHPWSRSASVTPGSQEHRQTQASRSAPTGGRGAGAGTAAQPPREGTGKTASTPPQRRPQRRVLRVAPRAFAWVRVPTAAYYLFRLYRGATLIFVARPRQNRLLLPSGWTFAGHRYRIARGRYRWSVRAGFGPPRARRYGREIVRATLVVQSPSA